ERVDEIIERLAEVRTPFFFERIPELAAPAQRSELVGRIAIFFTGYSRGVNISDEVWSRRRLGLAVRRLTTTTSIAEIERVAVDAAMELMKTDFAWFVRRDRDGWTLSHERGADEARDDEEA